MPKFKGNRFLLLIYFVIAVIGAGYIAYILKNYKLFRGSSVVVAAIFYWIGYGRAHYKVFKNTTFNRPIDSLKGFTFFLLFLIIFLIVYGRYFIGYFR